MSALELPPIPEEMKGFRCQVLADSVNADTGARTTTMLWKYPLIVHAEACRHRGFARSVASNRAIPTPRLLQMVREDPFTPLHWGGAKPGMQAGEELEGEALASCQSEWVLARTMALAQAERLNALGLHKQIANRVLVPYQWVTEVVTATGDCYANFFALRCHPAAEPHMANIAYLALGAYRASKPRELKVGEWHLPYVTPAEYTNCVSTADRMSQDSPPIQAICAVRPQLLESKVWLAKAVSAARTARTSYQTHDGKPSQPYEDLVLYARLIGQVPRHMSPTEHQLQARSSNITQVMKLSSTGSHVTWHGEEMRYRQFVSFMPHRLEFPFDTITRMEDLP